MTINSDGMDWQQRFHMRRQWRILPPLKALTRKARGRQIVAALAETPT